MLLALLVMIGGLVVAGLTASSAAVGSNGSGSADPSLPQEHAAVQATDGR